MSEDYSEYDEIWGERSGLYCDSCGSPIWRIGVCVCRRVEDNLYDRLVKCEGFTPEQAALAETTG